MARKQRSEGGGRKQSSEVSDVVASVTAQLDTVVAEAGNTARQIEAEAAEQAAAELGKRRREGDRLLADRQAALVELSEGVAARAAELGKRVDVLSAALSEAAPRLAELAGGAQAAPATGTEAAAVDAEATEATTVASPGLAEQESEAAREQAVLRATAMVLEGEDRERIETTLRRELGVADPAPLLDDILRRTA